MNNIIKKYFLRFLFLSILVQSSNAIAHTDSLKSKPHIVYDSSHVTVREMNPEDQQKLLENSDYKYDRVGPAPKGIWDRITEWFGRLIDNIFSSKAGDVGLTIFEYALILVVIIVIIILLIKNDIRAVFYGKSASVPIDFKEFDEDIHKINFNELIEESIAKKDFRKAVRLHFLKLLKELTDTNLIKWQIDKTNNDYSMELSSSKYSEKFKELALMYEYIWYGDLQMDEHNFKSIIEKFRAFQIHG